MKIKKKLNFVNVCNIAGVVIIALLLIMQFTPYWYNVNDFFFTPDDFEQYEASAPFGGEIAVPETLPEAKDNPDTFYVKCMDCDEFFYRDSAEVVLTPTKGLATLRNKLTKLPDVCPLCEGETGVAPLAVVDEKGEVTAFEDDIKPLSIAKAVWFVEETDEGSRDPILMCHVWTILLGAVCVYFCIFRMDGAFSWVPLVGLAVLNIMDYFKPEAMTGNLWIVHVILSFLLLVPAAALLVKWIIGAIRWFTVKDLHND